MAAATKTSEIKNEFLNLVDNNTEYTLQELKAILGDVFKTKNSKKVSSKKVNSPSSDVSGCETTQTGKVHKVKKAPNAYNIYVKEKMPEFKEKNPDTSATGLMSLIGASWKSLSKEDKDAYKTDKTLKSDASDDTTK